MPTPHDEYPRIAAYVASVRRRLRALYLVRALCASAGTAAIALLAWSVVAAPVLTAREVSRVWATAAAVAVLTLLGVMREALQRGAALASRWLAPADARLAAHLRTSLSLHATPDPRASEELLAAHDRSVAVRLGELPPARVVPVRALRHPTVVFGACAVLGCLVLAYSDPALRAFAAALLHPARLRADGTRVADVVAALEVRVLSPSYLGRAPELLRDPRAIRAPRGATLEVSVTPRFAAQGGVVQVGDRQAPLTTSERGRLRGRIGVTSSAAMVLRLDADRRRYEDSRARAVIALVDRTPTVEIKAPRSGVIVGPDEVLSVHFVANDDTGIAQVRLHARLPSGELRERHVFSSTDEGSAPRELQASTDLTPSELGARDGDHVSLWLVAHDEDTSAGPNAGKSGELVIEVSTSESKLASFLPELQALADGAVDLLGARLSRASPETAGAAAERFAALERATRAWLSLLRQLLAASHTERGDAGVHVEQLRAVHKRIERLLDQERALHAPAVASGAERARLDQRSVEELERDVLLLADLVAQEHIDEASAIAEELRALQKEIEALLQRLGKTRDKEAEQRLLAEIARAEQRLAELMQSMSRMAAHVPSEFVNRDALRSEEAQSSLQDLAGAVRRGDLEAATSHLASLAKQIDELTRELRDGGLRMRQSAYGPEDRAMAQARRELDMLAAEQGRLAERSEAAARSVHPGGPVRHRDLEDAVRALGAQLRALQRERRYDPMAPLLDRAGERMEDARAALSGSDLSQAERMAEAAAGDLDVASSQLAQRAREVSRAIGQRRGAQAGQLDPAAAARLRNDAEPQRKARAAAQALQHALQSGPSGAPLSPGGAEQLEQARDAMQRAERALEQARPEEAAGAQRAATQQLEQLSRKLSEEQRGGGDTGGADHGGDGGDPSRESVRIPEADEFRGPERTRRRLLDAMREPAPKGHEGAVQRYYRELLR